ncbi:MAG TPA: diacylglycerol kinase family protein [Acidimicrobiales bacterium]|nr:diacylglycerol kinase family protein [Acidimicrobiales bacterium]
MAPRPHLVLANDDAGSTSRRDVALAVSRLAEHAPTELRWTSTPEEFERLVREASEQQLVIAGGDGSLHLALQTLDALDRTDEAIGIIPLGTGNDFARNHGIPLDPQEAADVVVGGQPRAVDAIELRDDGTHRELVANNLHLGMGVDSARAAQRFKPVLKRFAYPAATAWTGATGGSAPLRVTVEDEVVWDGPLLACLFLLGPSMGGGVELVDTNEGTIDVVVIEPVEPRDRVALVRAAMRDGLSAADEAHRWTGRRASVQAAGVLDTDIDGELCEHDRTLHLELKPRAWKVLVPQGGSTTG